MILEQMKFIIRAMSFIRVPLYVCLLFSGADQTEVYSHIKEKTQKHLDAYAREGLRTLCIAKKVTSLRSEIK